MTMKIKIEHIEGNSYAALVKQSDGDDLIVLNVSESVEISMHSGKSVTITEIGATAAGASAGGSVPDAPVPTPVDPAPAEAAPQAA